MRVRSAVVCLALSAIALGLWILLRPHAEPTSAGDEAPRPRAVEGEEAAAPDEVPGLSPVVGGPATPEPVVVVPPAAPVRPERDRAPAEAPGPPVARGLAVFDTGAPVSNAILTLTVPDDRTTLASGRTDAEGRFEFPVTGFGPCDVWVHQDGLRARTTADVRADGTITVPSVLLRVRVTPAGPNLVVTIVGVERPPTASLAVRGLSHVTWDTAHRDRNGKPRPGRRLACDGDLVVLLPRSAGYLVSASGPRLASEIVELPAPRAQEEVDLLLARAIDLPVTVVDLGGAAVPAARLSLSADSLPTVVGTVERGRCEMAGVLPGGTYRVQSESDSLEVVDPRTLVASEARAVEVRVRRLVRTEFLVVDPAGHGVEGAWVCLESAHVDPASEDGAMAFGNTDPEGRWAAWTRDFGNFKAKVIGPPGPDVGRWQGAAETGGAFRIEIADEPYTTVHLHPGDCAVGVAQGGAHWTVRGDAPVPLARDAGFSILGGGRYVWRRFRAENLPPGRADIELERAVRCRVHAPPEVTRLDVLQAGSPVPVMGTVVFREGPGRFDVRGLERGSRVGVVGRRGSPSSACTPRVEFVAEDGAVVELAERPNSGSK